MQTVDTKSLQQIIYESVVRRSRVLIGAFRCLYIFIIIYLIAGNFAIASGSNFALFFLTQGKLFGQMAILILGVIVLPGILGRLGIEIRLTRLITLFRRQLGITMFLLAFTHYNHVRFVARAFGVIPASSLPIYEIFGLVALSVTFFLFITSNNFSQKNLGRWWKRIHRLIYVILWLLVLHTSLQRISMWSIFIFVMAMLEVISLAYSYVLRRKI